MRSTPRSRRAHGDSEVRSTADAFRWIVVQLVAVDLVFSLDSIITAIGMAEDLEVMIAAVVIAMIVMYVAANPVGNFISEHPTTKMLALAFLVLIGVALIADGFEFHIPRGYIYFAMAFAGCGRSLQRAGEAQPAAPGRPQILSRQGRDRNVIPTCRSHYRRGPRHRRGHGAGSLRRAASTWR